MIYYIYIIGAVLLAGFSQVLLKKSAIKKHDSIIKEYLNVYVIVGYGLLFLSTFLNILAFKGLPYINATILQSVSYTLVMFLSFQFFKEKITLNKIIGNIVIIIGIVVFCI